MIKCPECASPVEISRRQQPLKKVESTEKEHRFRLCWTVESPAYCPKCSAVIPIEFLEEALPEEIPVSEGSKIMSSRNKKRFTPASARKAANERWSNEKPGDLEE